MSELNCDSQGSEHTYVKGVFVGTIIAALCSNLVWMAAIRWSP